jgi:predicted Rossmann fold nucleotide-binding protein DprA/Smf involved in DNA uptake
VLTELQACQLPVAAAQATFSKAVFRDAEKELAQVRKAGCRLIHWEESDYPKRLLEIYDPPPLLYVRGNEQVLNRHTISIIGTRRPTPYGNQTAERLAQELAEQGPNVVSGLAPGMESSAHRGACAASREFGRQVYGVPGNVTDPVSFAPNQLVKQGAKLVIGWEDVVGELPTEIRAELFPVEATTHEERASLFETNLSPIEKRLFDPIRIEKAIHVDELVETTGLSSSETLAALCEMEMRGIIRQMPGKQFVWVLV